MHECGNKKSQVRMSSEETSKTISRKVMIINNICSPNCEKLSRFKFHNKIIFSNMVSTFS